MMFMVSVALMLLEILLLHRSRGDRRPLRALFDLESPAPLAAAVPRRRRATSAPLLAAAALTAACATAMAVLPAPRPVIPSRDTFTSFPAQIAGWSGRRTAMESVYLDGLKLDDYLLADYVRAGGLPVSLYLAWYDTQSAGRATHSPRACLPAGGWRILSLRQASDTGLKIGSQPLRFNRAVIESGDHKELVYYWFQQRGRVVTNEYLVKWYLLVDALFRHRTDGALIRLIAPVPLGTPIEAADRELRSFTAVLVRQLTRYVPG
jgi:EpsI family protein